MLVLLREIRHLERLLKLAGVEKLVKELDYLLGAELDHAHARAHEPLLHYRDALLQLCPVLLELLVGE